MHHPTLTSLALLAAIAGSAMAEAPATLDLSGPWNLRLDPEDKGVAENWQALPAFPPPSAHAPSLAGQIALPGCLQAQGFGEKPSIDGPWTGMKWKHRDLFPEGQSPENFKTPFMLQPPRLYVGAAWYRREIEIPESWRGKRLSLHLERVHWQCTAWLDGKKLGFCDSLGTPHVFDISKSGGSPTVSPSSPSALDLGHSNLALPGRHTLTLRIDNRLSPVNPGPLSHSVTDATQGNWNGAVGRLELRAAPATRITRVDVFPKAATGVVRLRVHVAGIGPGSKGVLIAGIRPHGAAKAKGISTDAVSAKAPFTDLDIAVPNVRPWDEFSPNLYDLDVHLDLPESRHTLTRTIGFRDLGTRDGRITINGRKTFLRGTLECCIFPLTGHPPTEIEPWRRIFRIAKSHGLNHMRFHSWCPPEAAFAAADEIGFYLQPEVSSWANGTAAVGSGRPLDKWLDTETGRMLRAYGHHPSFVMLAYGNEPGGKDHNQWLQGWVARWKKHDPLRLYTTACGWPVMPGSDWHSSPRPRIQGWGQGLGSIINSQPPGTDFDWSGFVQKHTDAPVVSHEIGQWCAYPNFDEIKKYTGYFKARNFELFRDQAQRHGLLPQAHDFLVASGKLQTLAYKHDIEAALRTPGFGGFQLLDLHDFPGQGTALVGVLDAFWDEKGYVTPKEYSRFCGPTVPLLRTKRFVLTEGEPIEAEAQLAHFGPEDLKGAMAECEWVLSDAKGREIASYAFPARDYPTGDLHKIGHVSIDPKFLRKVKAPAHVVVALRLPKAHIENSWDFFIFPKSEHPGAPPESPKVKTTSDLDEALAALDAGKSVLWLPPAARIRNDPKHPLRAGFSPIFWNTAWTNWQPPHTLGLLCDPAHPALAKFPTESHSNWQWWEIVTDSQPFILTGLRDIKPIVQPIDDWFTNRKLGLVFEARVGKGKLVACAADLTTNLATRPAARQLRASLLAYMAGDAFAPEPTLAPADIENLIKPPSVLQQSGAKATATSAEPGYPPAAAIDDDPATLWHTEFSKQKPGPPHDLVLAFPEPVSIGALLVTQRQDKNPNGQVRKVEILDQDGHSIAKAKIRRNASTQRISLPKTTRFEKLVFRVHSSYAGPFATLAELDVVPAAEPNK